MVERVVYVKEESQYEASELRGEPKVFHELGRYGHDHQELGGSGYARPELDGRNRF